MKKDKLSLDSLGDIRKPERNDPDQRTTQQRRRVGRPNSGLQAVPLTTRISVEADQQLRDLANEKDCTMREVLEQALDLYYKRNK